MIKVSIKNKELLFSVGLRQEFLYMPWFWS
jgi:hypothetical protein